MSGTPIIGRASPEAAAVAVGRASVIPVLITRSRGQGGSFLVRTPESAAVRAYVRMRQSRGTITDEHGGEVGHIEATGNVVSYYNSVGIRTGYALVNETTGGLRFFDLERGTARAVGEETVSQLSPLVQEIVNVPTNPAAGSAPSGESAATDIPPSPEDEKKIVPSMNQTYPDLPSVFSDEIDGWGESMDRMEELPFRSDRVPKDKDAFVVRLTTPEGWATRKSRFQEPVSIIFREDGRGTRTSESGVESFDWEVIIVLDYFPKQDKLAARIKMDGTGDVCYFEDIYVNGTFTRCEVKEPVQISKVVRDREIREGRLPPDGPPVKKKSFWSRIFGGK